MDKRNAIRRRNVTAARLRRRQPDRRCCNRLQSSLIHYATVERRNPLQLQKFAL
jgi:hypothetical protein